MGKKLFVGSFPQNTTKETLKELFDSCGQVASLMIVIDVISGLSRGFGFVEMATEEAAITAVEKLNGYKIEDRNIVVKEALAKTSYRGMHDTNRRFGNRTQRRF